MEANPDAAVIALYSAATYGNSAQAKKPVSEYYEIPEINMLPIVKKAVNNSYFKEEDYYTDTVHPTKEGHELMADCLINLMSVIEYEASDEKVLVPEEYLTSPEKAFSDFHRIFEEDENVKISYGSFTEKDDLCQTMKKNGKSGFSNNFKSDGGLESMIITLNCKSFFFVYKEEGSWLNIDYGRAEVYVDGILEGVYDGGPDDGWNGCITKILFDEEESREHTIEIKAIDGLPFTIAALGYSK